MRIAGVFLIVIGLVLTLTFFGAFVGVPLMIVGAIMTLAGGRRSTINNIIHVNPDPIVRGTATATGLPNIEGTPGARQPALGKMPEASAPWMPRDR